LLNGVKQFSNLNLAASIYWWQLLLLLLFGRIPEAAVVIVLYVLWWLEDIGLENSKSALDQLVNRAPKTAFVKLENKTFPLTKLP
jgi:Cd2+/Zn2+-exporting ATPase